MNPFPRTTDSIRSWCPDLLYPVTWPGDHNIPTTEFDPYVKWFNAEEDVDYRYRCYDTTTLTPYGDSITSVFSRQIKLVDNEGNSDYSGIKLRGDEYWANVSAISLSATLPNAAQPQNNQSPQYAIRNGLGSSNLYFDFNGEPDFNDGCVTGIGPQSVLFGNGMVENITNPGGLIQNPADIIAHFILKYTKINGDRGKVDWPSFRKARGMLNGWRFSTFLNEIMSGQDIIGRWQAQCRSHIYKKNNRFYMRYIDLNPNREIKCLFNDGNIDRDSLSVDFNKSGELYNKFTIKYDYYRPHDTYNKIIEFDSTNHDACRVSEQVYGATKHFQFDCADIVDDMAAGFLANYFIELYTKQRLAINLSSPVTTETMNIEVGDVVVVQTEELPNRVKFERLNQGRVVPAKMPFIVFNIVLKNNSYEYSLLQLHPRSTFV
jgi:hypothetical protein